MFGFLQNASDWVADTVSQLGLEETLQSVGLNAAEVGHAAVYLGIGVAAGFMTRKYFRILVVGLLIAFLCVKWMEFKGFLVVDWSTFNQFVGLDSVTDAHIQNMFS
ncbi:hypothetical protein HOD08_04330, partial [bacterium]|nr:hypothetical protein [bacterium]